MVTNAIETAKKYTSLHYRTNEKLDEQMKKRAMQTSVHAIKYYWNVNNFIHRNTKSFN